ncbi:MAG: diguanylate cyclase [Treponema sp.]|nr:diguanylate cyclase [Treponema sp.]
MSFISDCRRLFLIIVLITSSSLFAKTVKVGYYINSGNFMDGFSEEDPKSGYAYEYMQTISSYTGWDYEYVYGEWDDLYEALLSGKIDILSDVSYTKERENILLYPDYPMGQETFYLYTNDKNTSISAGDFSSWKGKKIGLRTDCYQYELFLDWKKDKKLECEYVEFSSDAPYYEMFQNHEFDILLEIDMVAELDWNPIARIGSSDFFLTVTKNRPDILKELNSALAEIFSMDPYYNNTLWLKYFSNMTISKNLSVREQNWLENHPVIKLGCLYGDLPFCDINEENFRAEGLIADMMQYMQEKLLDNKSSVSIVLYHDAAQMLSDLKMGKIDAIAPVARKLQPAEEAGLCLSQKFTSLVLGYAYSGETVDSSKENWRVAVPYNLRAHFFLQENYPNAVPVFCTTYEDCLDAVLKGEADGTFFNISKIRGLINKNKRFRKLNSVELNGYGDSAFLSTKENIPLISMLNKLIMLMPAEEVSSSANRYSIKEQGYTRKHFFLYYLNYIIMAAVLLASITLALIISLRHVVYTIEHDTLTQLLNRRNFEKYMTRFFKHAAQNSSPFCVMMFDLDNFKSLNDTCGHAFGDKVLSSVAAVISSCISQKDKAFRWGGEEFLIVCNGDMNHACDVAEKIRTGVEVLDMTRDGQRVPVTVTVGISPYRSGLTYKNMFLEADKYLYQGKSEGKNRVVCSLQ